MKRLTMMTALRVDRLLLLTVTLLLALPTTPALACSAMQTITLDANNRWEGGRQNLYRSLRYTATRTDERIGIVVQYQKAKSLLCEIVPGGDDICQFFQGTEFEIDNRSKLDDWHTSIKYTGIELVRPDSGTIASFSQDYISGTYDRTNNSLVTLSVNSPGRVVFAKPAGNVALTGCPSS